MNINASMLVNMSDSIAPANLKQMGSTDILRKLTISSSIALLCNYFIGQFVKRKQLTGHKSVIITVSPHATHLPRKPYSTFDQSIAGYTKMLH